MKFIIGDPESGELTRVTAKGPEEALVKYICFLAPGPLTPEDFKYILQDGGFVVWEDVGIQNFPALTREDGELES